VVNPQRLDWFIFWDADAGAVMNGYRVVTRKNLGFALSVRAPTGTDPFTEIARKVRANKILA
jgi:hypothetical protein